MVIKGTENQKDLITAVTAMNLQNNQGANTGMEATELEIPMFSGETSQY